MRSHVTGLDHVIIAVRDLEAAADRFRALGFTVTPRGRHPQWGTANACVMFGADYVELLAAEGEGGPAEAVRAFTAGREGLMSLAFGSDDAGADGHRLGLAEQPPGDLSRMVEGAAGPVRADFRIQRLPPEATPGASCFLCQHLTPEVLRQPGWTRHANGADGIASVTGLVDDPLALMGAWDRLVGPASTTATDDLVTVHAGRGGGGRGLVFFCRPEDVEQLHPEADGEELPPPPALVALTIRVADTATAAGILSANGVAFSRDQAGTVRVPASGACGVFLELVAG